MWLGAVCPWKLIADSSILTPWRIIGVSIAILLFRRMPSMFLLHGYIWQMKAYQQALFTGFFGPIGVSAMFYLHKTLEYLQTSSMKSKIGSDEVARLGQHMTVVVWTLVIASVVSDGTKYLGDLY
jgi:NhaP-type Na+/H+ or K+/H+ antiporter